MGWSVSLLYHVFPTTWQETSMPSLAYLQMYWHRDICAAPLEVKG